MNMSNPKLRARTAVPAALAAALQWRLLLLWVVASLGCALVAALPVWNWLADTLNHSLQASAIATGKAPMLLVEALIAPDSPKGVLMESNSIGLLLMLLASPWLVGASITAARARTRLGFGDLMRGAVTEYGPLLRMLLWSAIPLGFAIMAMGAFIGINEKLHAHPILASEVASGRQLAIIAGGVLFILMHAMLEAGRGWLASDARLRSALKAWWRGFKLLSTRPIATLSAYLLPTLCSLLVAALMLWLRQRLDADSTGGFLLAMLASCAMAAGLAWGKVARLFAMQALANDSHRRR